MTTVSATEARKRLYALIDEVGQSHEPVQITGKRGNAVLLSEDDWRAIQETLHLVSIPGMRESILTGMATDVSELSEDGDFAELLKLRLEREGYQAWVDSDRLDPGNDWREELDQGIRGALLVIAVMTPDARVSEYVTYEWAFAWGYGKKVIPIMLRQTTLHPRLATLQYLDFTNRIARPWSRLFEVLANSNNTGKT